MGSGLLLVFLGFFILWLLAQGKEGALSRFVSDVFGGAQ